MRRQPWAALVVLCGGREWAQKVEAEVKSALPQARCVVVADQGAEGIARRYEAAVLQVLDVLQRIVQGRPKDQVLIQAVVPVAEKMRCLPRSPGC